MRARGQAGNPVATSLPPGLDRLTPRLPHQNPPSSGDTMSVSVPSGASTVDGSTG
jgi:hypothetical protein